MYRCEAWIVTLRKERRLREFRNRVLRRIFGPMRDEVTGEWTRLHIEELNDLYSLPNIIRVMKSRKMRWAGYVACIGDGRCAYKILVEKRKRRSHLEDLGEDGRIIVKWIYKNLEGEE
jgi:hypothetical protein